MMTRDSVLQMTAFMTLLAVPRAEAQQYTSPSPRAGVTYYGPVPPGVVNTQNRIRVVNPYDNSSYTRYYGDNGTWAGTAWYGGPQVRQRAYQDANQYNNRQRWGSPPASRPNRNSGGGMSAAQQYGYIKSQSDQRIANINSQSSQFRQQSSQNLNNFGAQTRGQMMGGGSSGGRIGFNDNAPGK